MVNAETLRRFEDEMRADRGWKRGQLCVELGISQPTWRKLLETDGPVDNRTLALAIAAVRAGLPPFETATL